MSKFTDQHIAAIIRQARDQLTLSAAHKTAMRRELMEAIKSPTETLTNPSHIFNRRNYIMPLVPIIIAILLALGGSTAALADQAKPGDALYPIDQWVERMQEKLTTNTTGRAKLLAALTQERLKELEAVSQIDPSEFEAKAKELWEEHQQEAVERLTASIERVQELQAQFQTKLANATTDKQKEVFLKIINHLKEVEAKREARLDLIDDKTFPGLSQVGAIRQSMIEYRQEHREELKQIREEVREEMQELLNKTEDEDEDEDEDEVNDDDEDETTPPVQTSVEMRIPRDENGNIDWDLLDTDHDGSPDKNDPNPGMPPYTL